MLLHHAPLFRSVATFLAVASCTTFAAAADGPIDIGSRRELFVDRALVERLEGAELQLQRPQSGGVALTLDKPWEGNLSGYFTVLRDGEKVRMYYRGRPLTGYGDGAEQAQEVTCVAESADGKTWTRPTIGRHQVAGTKDNNIILAGVAPITHNFAPFVDTRPGTPAAERYKAVGGSSESGLVGYVSADGLEWRRLRDQPIITGGAFDSQNNVWWSEHEQRYVCFFRTFRNGVRWITRTTSTDFLNWEPPTDMTFGDAPNEHLYTNQTEPYFRAPHLYVGTAARFWPGRRALTDEQAKAIEVDSPKNYVGLKAETSDCVLLTSRGGTRYDRTFLESFVRPGGDLRNWTARSNYPARAVVQTGPTEMSFYIQRHYGQPTTFIERMTLRLDGFAAVRAGYGGGELTTKTVKFSGSRLMLNFASSAAGQVQVELQDAAGQPIPGFALADCRPLIGDDVQRTVEWKTADVSALAGQPVRLRIKLKDAEVFAFQFAAPPTR